MMYGNAGTRLERARSDGFVSTEQGKVSSNQPVSSQVFNSGQAAPHRAPPSASRPSLVGKPQRLLKKETTRFLLFSITTNVLSHRSDWPAIGRVPMLRLPSGRNAPSSAVMAHQGITLLRSSRVLALRRVDSPFGWHTTPASCSAMCACRIRTSPHPLPS